MLLEDYNYLINKAVQQYTNKVYNRYEINQQATDDLRVLKDSVKLPVIVASSEAEEPYEGFPNEDKEYCVVLPSDYLHLLNCVIQYKKVDGAGTGKCPTKDSGANLIFPARKLTADIYPSIIINAYLKPDTKRPYYFITNVHGEDTPSYADEIAKLLGEEPEKNTGIKMQIRCGHSTKYVPAYAYIDYIRAPKRIEIKESDLDLVNGVDQSPEMEFPDYVCYEIINEFAKLLLENASDARLQSYMPINQSIATPGN